MSLEAYGDEGSGCSAGTECARCGGDHYQEGYADGWERALEWAAKFIESGYPTPGDRADPHALAMSLRAAKDRARKGEA